MSVCVPKHIICDTYQTGYVPGPGTSTLSTIQTGRRARSKVGSNNAPVGGALWRSQGLGPLDNQLSINIIWQDIRRFNGFEFSTPPIPSAVSSSTEYVEIDVKIEILLDGQLISTYYKDQTNTPLFTQTAEWDAIVTEETNGGTGPTPPDTTVLCWNCIVNTTDTSNIIQTLRSVINSQDQYLKLPEEDVQTSIQVDDGMGGTVSQQWNAVSHDQDHIGPSNVEILNIATDLDQAAIDQTPYIIQNFSLSGATLPEPQGTSGPFYTLIHVFDSEEGNDNGSVTEDINATRYWGQENTQTCYGLSWIDFESGTDCGMHIIGFDVEQNQFIIDDQVQNDVAIGDTLKIFGPEISEASASIVAEFGSYRTTFQVNSVNQPGDGTTKIGVTETLNDVADNYQGVAAICRPSQC